jgi:hypothetical protein
MIIVIDLIDPPGWILVLVLVPLAVAVPVASGSIAGAVVLSRPFPRHRMHPSWRPRLKPVPSVVPPVVLWCVVGDLSLLLLVVFGL